MPQKPHDQMLTRHERKAIEDLHDLAARWPRTLWLFSANGALMVMKKNKAGERAMEGTGVDPRYAVSHPVDIPNDGGDW